MYNCEVSLFTDFSAVVKLIFSLRNAGDHDFSGIVFLLRGLSVGCDDFAFGMGSRRL